jgi:hypothetical protein
VTRVVAMSWLLPFRFISPRNDPLISGIRLPTDFCSEFWIEVDSPGQEGKGAVLHSKPQDLNGFILIETAGGARF